MLELHVWGADQKVSIIDPESIAAAWLLSIHLILQQVDFQIVTSNNTNLAKTGRLPLLLTDDKERIEGYEDIAHYISTNYPTDSTKFVPNQKLLSNDQLVNATLISWMKKTINYVNQYNLYVNTKNYENFTRKLFLLYLPFPMMYNQPLKFYNYACEQVKLIGLGSNSSGFFGVGKSDTEVPDTELINDDDEHQEVAISGLHEKMLLKKNQSKAALKESRNTVKCAAQLHEYIKHIHDLFNELNENSPVDFAHLFRPKKVASSELLLYAYFAALTDPRLPDQFAAEYLKTEFNSFWKFASVICEALNGAMSPDHIRSGEGTERPTLLNEVGSLLGLIRY